MDKEKNYEYYYRYVTRGRYGIFHRTAAGEQDVCSAYDKTIARIMVWHLNGWGVPKGVDPEGEEYKFALRDMEKQIKWREEARKARNKYKT